MSKNSGTNLFKEPANWPQIPPWWLLSSPQAAALLNVTSATLHNWRVRGEGPAAVPPMYLRSTQGDPIYYLYGLVRSWAAERLGLSYSIEDQCIDFLKETIPWLSEVEATWRSRAWAFDNVFEKMHRKVINGETPNQISKELIQEMDLFYAKQPRQLLPVRDLCE